MEATQAQPAKSDSNISKTKVQRKASKGNRVGERDTKSRTQKNLIQNIIRSIHSMCSKSTFIQEPTHGLTQVPLVLESS